MASGSVVVGLSTAALSAPWRNKSFMVGTGRDPPLSDQGETVIGVYLLLLGEHGHICVLVLPQLSTCSL